MSVGRFIIQNHGQLRPLFYMTIKEGLLRSFYKKKNVRRFLFIMTLNTSSPIYYLGT